MTVFVVTLVVFLSGGQVVTASASFPTIEQCEAKRFQGELLVGKSLKDSAGNDQLILDAQVLPCISITQQTHA